MELFSGDEVALSSYMELYEVQGNSNVSVEGHQSTENKNKSIREIAEPLEMTK